MATAVTTKKRSTASRKPRADPRSLLDAHDFSPPSSDPSSENKHSPESEGFDPTGKVFHLNTSSLKTSSINKIGGVAVSERRKDSKDGRDRDGNSGSKGNAPSGSGEGKVRKLKLKLAGVTHTLHTNASAESAAEGRSGSKNVHHSSEASRHQKKLSLQGNSDEDSSRGKTTEENSSEPVRKSKRVPKKKVLDGAFDEEEDDEIRYLERLRNSKLSVQNVEEQEEDHLEGSKNRKNGKASKSKRINYDVDEDYGSSRRSREAKKRLSSDIESKDDNTEEEDPESDAGPESKKRKADVLIDSDDGKKEFALTTRQRALQSSGGKGSSAIEFPDGLPPPPPRKQKEKLSEVEQQLKKAEAARRRRIQVEKAARESEAEAIRKILGQDSSRKKREDKQRKKREELAQERAANSMTLPPDFVRLVMGPTGTTVIFPEGVGLPSVFDSKPCSYPPPREKCAGPSCTNAYKYRDSKSKLPLCSLECYRAVRQNTEQLTSC